MYRAGLSSAPCGQPQDRSLSGAFTLIEVLLVLAIIGIVTVVTLPSFVSSLRGNRLRAASRTLVSAGRYARSMAVMQQVSMALVLDLDKATVSVRPAAPGDFPGEESESSPVAVQNGPSPVVATDDTDSILTEPAEGTAVPKAADSPVETVSRPLDRVKIAKVVMGNDGTVFEKGTCVVLYRTNGTCLPYDAELEGPDGDRVIVTVDSVSSATVETAE